jgi:hypothetical protein
MLIQRTQKIGPLIRPFTVATPVSAAFSFQQKDITLDV